MSALGPGSVVQLKSGGPLMTVTTIVASAVDGAQTLCRCMFFMDNRMHEILVPDAALKESELAIKESTQ